MKKIVFFALVLFLTVKITLYLNKKQSEKLLIEKKSTSSNYEEKDKEEISKAMHKFESLKARMRKELNQNKHIVSTKPSPIETQKKEDDIDYDQYNLEDDSKYFENEESDEEDNENIENFLESYEDIEQNIKEDSEFNEYDDDDYDDSDTDEDEDDNINRQNQRRRNIKTIRTMKRILKDNESIYIKLGND